MITLGIGLALACALMSNVALLCKHRGATRAPDVRFRRPLESAKALFASRWWTIGFAIAFVAWGLHVAALALAPLSLVQSVIAGGIALLAVPGASLVRDQARLARDGRAGAERLGPRVPGADRDRALLGLDLLRLGDGHLRGRRDRRSASRSCSRPLTAGRAATAACCSARRPA